MTSFFIDLKNAIFGIVVAVWGVVLLTTPALNTDVSLELLRITFSQPIIGLFFMAVGLLHVFTKVTDHPILSASANVLIAFVFVTVMLTHLFASVYMIAWIAFGGLTIHQIINAFLILKGRQ